MGAQISQDRLLQRLRPAERVAAISQAWPWASAQEHESYGWALLDLAASQGVAGGVGKHGSRRDAVRMDALAALAIGWATLGEDARRVGVSVGRGCWESVLAALGPSGWSRAGRSLAVLSRDTGDPAFLAALGELVVRGEREAVGAAARALLTASCRVVPSVEPGWLGTQAQAEAFRPVLDPTPPVWSSADVASLLETVASGVDTFADHGRREVLLAALVLLDGPRRRWCRSDPLAEIAREPRSAAFRTLRTAFRQGRFPLARQRAWLWLREESLAAACLDRIGRASSFQDHLALLDFGHLALAPARAGRLRMLEIATVVPSRRTLPPGAVGARRLHPEGVAPARAVLRELPVRARRRVPWIVSLLSGPESARAFALESFLTDDDAVARLAAARECSSGMIDDFCFDPHAVVARHAATRRCGIGVSESRRPRAADAERLAQSTKLTGSPHAAVRSIGVLECARLRAGNCTLSRLAARRLWQRDRQTFRDWVRGELASGEAGIAALMAARAVGAVGALEGTLFGLVRDSLDRSGAPDPRVVATAVACLGELRSTRADSVLEQCVRHHTDARTRSNAAEALGRGRRGCFGLLADLAGEGEHHRLRGGVVRAALAVETKPGEPNTLRAIDTVESMLTDGRWQHRLAGVWAVQRSLGAGVARAAGARWDRVACRLRWLADEDGDAAIRRRAALVTHRLDMGRFGVAGSVA